MQTSDPPRLRAEQLALFLVRYAAGEPELLSRRASAPSEPDAQSVIRSASYGASRPGLLTNDKRAAFAPFVTEAGPLLTGSMMITEKEC